MVDRVHGLPQAVGVADAFASCEAENATAERTINRTSTSRTFLTIYTTSFFRNCVDSKNRLQTADATALRPQ